MATAALAAGWVQESDGSWFYDCHGVGTAPFRKPVLLGSAWRVRVGENKGQHRWSVEDGRGLIGGVAPTAEDGKLAVEAAVSLPDDPPAGVGRLDRGRVKWSPDDR